MIVFSNAAVSHSVLTTLPEFLHQIQYQCTFAVYLKLSSLLIWKIFYFIPYSYIFINILSWIM